MPEAKQRHVTEPGRVCPLRYRYGPAAIARAPERPAVTLYVIGGLYANPEALASVEAMARAEPGPVTLCFNGDFNWFNVDDASFRAINERVLRHDAIAAATAFTVAAFGAHVYSGGAYEARTAIAMGLRTLVWVTIAAIAWCRLPRRPA